jgi:hypothetical protein
VQVAEKGDSMEYAMIARERLDSAMHSCQFWWASKRPMWSINMIYRGMAMQREVLLNAYKSISLSSCRPETKKEYFYKVIAGRHLFDEITDALYIK